MPLSGCCFGSNRRAATVRERSLSPLPYGRGSPRSLRILALLAALVLSAAPSQAQPPAPVIQYVYPAGGQRGKTVEVTIAGDNLQGATGLYLSGRGAAATITKIPDPKT